MQRFFVSERFLSENELLTCTAYKFKWILRMKQGVLNAERLDGEIDIGDETDHNRKDISVFSVILFAILQESPLALSLLKLVF